MPYYGIDLLLCFTIVPQRAADASACPDLLPRYALTHLEVGVGEQLRMVKSEALA